MSSTVSYIIQAVDRFTPVAKKISRSLDKVKDRINKASKSMRNFGKSMQRVGAGLSLKVSAPIIGIGLLAVKAAADIEMMEISFTALLGSGEAAGKMMKKLIDFTARTPFQLEDVGKATVGLIGYEVAQKDVMSTLQMLGDIAAIAKVPLNDLVASYGKASAVGKLYTEELKMIAERGIPIISALEKKLGVTTDQVFEMASKGKISFKIFQSAMRGMTSKGGKYFEGMKRASEGILGLFSTLKDNVTLALAEIGITIVKSLKLKEKMKSVTKFIQDLTEKIKKFTKANPLLTKIILLILGVTAAIGPLLVVLGTLGIVLGGVGIAIHVIISPVTLIILAVVALSIGVYVLWKKFKLFRDIVKLTFLPIRMVWMAIKGIGDAIMYVISAMGKFGAKARENQKAFASGVNENKMGSGMFGASTKALLATSKSTSEINVNIKDPGNQVQGIRSRFSGFSGFKVGYNMKTMEQGT